MNEKMVKVAAGTAIAALMLIMVAPVFAASISNIVMTGTLTDGADCEFNSYWSFDYDDLATSIVWHMTSYLNGVPNGVSTLETTPPPSSGSDSGAVNWHWGTNPESCGALVQFIGDGEVLYTRVWGTVPGYGNNAYAPWFYTPESADELTTANHQTVLYNGVEACGVFESDWFGRKYLSPENFPACAEFLPDEVEVACMNGEAEWMVTNVTDAGVSEGVFWATVEQHGTCGIFPTR